MHVHVPMCTGLREPLEFEAQLSQRFGTERGRLTSMFDAP